MNDTQRPTVTLEWFLYGLIVVAALALRLFQLGYHPLNDVEAREALGASGAVEEPRGLISGRRGCRRCAWPFRQVGGQWLRQGGTTELAAGSLDRV